MTRVLVVTEDIERGAEWFWTLADEGYQVDFCGGPTLAPCARVGAGMCPLREHADVAVVEIQGPGELPYGEWDDRACTKIPDDGTTIFVSDARGPRGPGAHLVHPVTRDELLAAVDRMSMDVAG